MSAVFHPVRRTIFLPISAASLTLVILLAATSTAQTNRFAAGDGHIPLFESVITDPPLPSSSVDAITQDHRGFLWFGTADGLCRYDGYSPLMFKHQPNDSQSLHSNSVKSILPDDKNRLWVGTTRGLSFIDLRTYKVTRLPVLGWILGLYQDKAGRIWVGSRGNGLFVLNEDGSIINHVRTEGKTARGLPSDSVSAFFQHSDGTMWIGTGQGIVRCREDYDPMDPLTLVDKTGRPPFVSGFYQDRVGEIWVSTRGQGVIRMNDRGEVLKWYEKNPKDPTTPSGSWVMCATEDPCGNVWFGTMDFGLNRFDRTTGRFYNYVHEDVNIRSSFTVTSLYRDRSGLIWLGTERGVRKFNTLRTHFAYYRPSDFQVSKDVSNDVRAIAEDRSGNLWLGLDGIKEGAGLVCLNRKKGTLEVIAGSDLDPLTIYPRVLSIVKDSGGILWLGTFDGGLYRYDPSTGRHRSFRHRPDDPWSISGDNIQCMVGDPDGSLWIGTLTGGLNRFDPRSGRFERFYLNASVSSGLGITIVHALLVDRAGTLWIGGNGGLIEFDRKSRMLRRHRDISSQLTPSNSRAIRCIFEDSRGVLWVGTTAGLEKHDRSAGTVKLFSEEQGMANPCVNGILEDSSGYLWLSTNSGITRFKESSPPHRQFRNYTSLDGIQGAGAAFYKTNDGEFLVCGPPGVLAFFPGSMAERRVSPPVVFSSFSLQNKRVHFAKATHEITSIEIPYSENILSFEFAALDFVLPAKNRYAYILDGFERTWTFADNRRYFTYTNLDPGSYTLRVKAANSYGIWNDHGAAVELIIIPPWWKTTWAYIGFCVVGLLLVVTLRRYESNRRRFKVGFEMGRVEAGKLRELDHLKSRFFANISHEFRTPLTLIEGPIQRLRSGEYKGDPKMQYDIILRNSRHMLHLVNQLLDLAKVESGEMKRHMQEQDLSSVVKWIASAFESNAQQKGIEFTIDGVEERILGWFDRDAVEKMLTNLLSNAFKFTDEGGTVRVLVRYFNSDFQNDVEISVSDTGIGIPPEEVDKIFNRFYQVDASHTREYSGTGIGLALTRELAELHHGWIHVTSEVGKGSTFAVWLPIGKNHLKPDDIVTGPAELTPLSQPEWSNGTEDQRSLEQCPHSSDGLAPLLLIVEDNIDMRQYIRNSLDHGCRILESVNGVSALEKAIEEIPDLIISDVMMPTMDGYELCRMLKQNEKTSHIPVILLTAKAGIENRIEGLETGADDYLVKPFDAGELIVRVRNLINGRRKLREKFERAKILRPGEIAVTSMDDVFLQKAIAVVEKFIAEEGFTVEQFSSEMNMSRVQLHRKLTALTGQSARDFVRYLRLHRGMDLLKKGAGNVSEVAYGVGFNSPAYFTKCFHEQFGFPPSDLNGKNGSHKPS